MKISQVGAQLYTVRDQLKGSSAFARTIERLKAIGSSAVELIHLKPSAMRKSRKSVARLL